MAPVLAVYSASVCKWTTIKKSKRTSKMKIEQLYSLVKIEESFKTKEKTSHSGMSLLITVHKVLYLHNKLLTSI